MEVRRRRKPTWRVAAYTERKALPLSERADRFNTLAVRRIPTDDKSLYTAVWSLEEAAQEGDIEEMERLEALIQTMHTLRGDGPDAIRPCPPWVM